MLIIYFRHSILETAKHEYRGNNEFEVMSESITIYILQCVSISISVMDCVLQQTRRCVTNGPRASGFTLFKIKHYSDML